MVTSAATVDGLNSETKNLRILPIPPAKALSTAGNYHEVPMALGEADEEPLIDLSTIGITCLSFYARADGRNAPYYRTFKTAPKAVYARGSVAGMLVEANHILRPYGVELIAFDGWRPISLQAELWQHFIDKGRAALTDSTPADLEKFALRYCSNPTGFDPAKPETCPAHNTGTSVDVLLRDRTTGFLCEHGCIFDEASARSETRHYENAGPGSQTDEEARATRRLLYHAMTRAGMVNYAGEYWHFDHPDSQFGIFNAGRKGVSAVYGPILLK